MTTLVGIVAEDSKIGVILASDVSRTQVSWVTKGDFAYRQQKTSEGQKIYVDDRREVALSMCGVYDQNYIDFLSGVLKGDIDIRRRVASGHFPEFEELNIVRWGGQVPNLDQMNSLLMATRFDGDPKLWTCWPMGKIEEKKWTSIGSGSSYALNYVQSQAKLIPSYLSLADGVDLAASSLNEASQDIYTGGLDLVVVTPKLIQNYGGEMNEAMDIAKRKAIEKVKKSVGKL